MSDLVITAAQEGIVDQRCDGQFGRSLPISNGVVCYNGTTAMSEAVYICDDLHLIFGEATRVCQNDSTWNGSIPQCSELDQTYLQELPQQTFANYTYFFSSSFAHFTHLSYCPLICYEQSNSFRAAICGRSTSDKY